VPTIITRPNEESRSGGLADFKKVFPPPLHPETEADRTPRESLLACMTANREPSNQSFETDREATVCTASRRFLLVSGSGNPAKLDMQMFVLSAVLTPRRFPPPWSVEETDA
jgi:hypothetical protein